jgi:uncharacterized membrane protein YhfC
MLYAALGFQFLFTVVGPIALAVALVRHGFGGWRLIFVGALTFVASQFVHIPLLVGLTLLSRAPGFPRAPHAWTPLVNALVLGLAAGACEEPARWIALARFAKTARGWRPAVLLGAGHGGCECVLLALGGLANLAFLVAVRGTGAEHLPAIDEAIAKLRSTPAWMPLVGAAERVAAMVIHVAASVIVMRGVVSGRLLWLGIAVLFHAAVDGFAVYGMARWGVLGTELTVFVFAAVGAVVVLRERDLKT